MTTPSDIRQPNPNRYYRLDRPVSLWSFLPSLGPVNTADYVATLYAE